MKHSARNTALGRTSLPAPGPATVMQSGDGSIAIKWPDTSLVVTRHHRDSSRRWTTAVVAISALGILAGAVMILMSVLSVGYSGVFLVKEPVTGDPRSKGNPDAQVTITVWSDFQCPACRTFALEKGPEIDRLLLDTGKARYVSRSLAFLGPESFYAAQAAQCAADQRRYWGYTNLLWQRYGGENTGALNTTNLKRFAVDLGLDQAAFNSCLDGREKEGAVAADIALGSKIGVKATPSVFVNDRLISGVPTLEQLGKLVDDELEKMR